MAAIEAATKAGLEAVASADVAPAAFLQAKRRLSAELQQSLQGQQQVDTEPVQDATLYYGDEGVDTIKAQLESWGVVGAEGPVVVVRARLPAGGGQQRGAGAAGEAEVGAAVIAAVAVGEAPAGEAKKAEAEAAAAAAAAQVAKADAEAAALAAAIAAAEAAEAAEEAEAAEDAEAAEAVPPPPAVRPHLQQNKSVSLSQGDRCKVYFKKYGRWYPGSVEELRYAKDGTGKYVVAFDDGDRGQYKMDLGQVKPLLSMLPPDGARYTEGQELLVASDKDWHPCIVVAVNAHSKHQHFKPNGRQAYFGSYKVLANGMEMDDVDESALQ